MVQFLTQHLSATEGRAEEIVANVIQKLIDGTELNVLEADHREAVSGKGGSVRH